MTIKIRKTVYLLIFFSTLSSVILCGCSKDESLLSQQNIVELTAEYTQTLKDITACNDRILKLEEELSNTPPESTYIIEEMIAREKEKLQELEQRRSELEKKLGLD